MTNTYTAKEAIFGYTIEVKASDLEHFRKKMGEMGGFDGYTFEVSLPSVKKIKTTIGVMKVTSKRFLGFLKYGYSTSSGPSEMFWTPVNGTKHKVDRSTGKLVRRA